MKNILLTFCIIFLGFGAATAQTKTETKTDFTLQEAQEYAILHSYSVKGTEYDLQIAKKQVWETIAEGLPQISASADYTKNVIIPKLVIQQGDSTVTFPMGSNYTSNATISVTQKIFDGAYIVGTMATKVYVQLSKDQKEKTEIEVKDAVAKAYYNVLVAKDNYKTIQENLVVNEKLLKETTAYFNNGFREELDVDQIRLNMKNNQNQLADAKRAIKTSLVILKFAMGMNIENTIDLSDELSQLVNPIRLQNPEEENYSFEHHIDYKIINTQLKAQQLIVKKEKAAFLPTLSAFANYGKSANSNVFNVFDADVPWFESAAIGLKFNLSIFSAGMKRSKVNQEKIKYKKLENTQFETQQNLKKELSLSMSNLLTAKEKYENDVEAREIAKRIYDRTRIKFNEGLSTSTELSENEKQYLDAHTTYIQSTLQLLNSKIAFDKALGEL